MLAGRRFLGRAIARHRGNPVVRGLARLSREFLLRYQNVDYEIATNGEAFLLRALAAFELATIVDVGANVGEWTAAAKASFPRSEVHAFEIAEPTFGRLCEKVGARPGVHCVNLGLSDSDHTVRLRYYDAFPALTTGSDYPHPLPHRMIEGRTITGAGYLRSQGIERVDFLKIDVEGMEREVLAGFEPFLAKGAVDLVQFEYGRVNIITKVLLRDFYAFFGERSYVVGKIYPDHVDFRDYTLTDEDFLGPNYLACRSARSDYIAALRQR